MGTLKLREIAEHLDMSESNASAIVRDLGIDRETADLAACRVAYIRDLREKAAGRNSDRTALDAAKTRQAQADAQLKELDYFERVGALVPAAQVAPLVGGWATTARAEVHNAVEKLIAGIESKHGINIEPEFVEDTMGSAYSAIAAYPGQPGAGAAAGGPPMAADQAHVDAAVVDGELPAAGNRR